MVSDVDDLRKRVDAATVHTAGLGADKGRALAFGQLSSKIVGSHPAGLVRVDGDQAIRAEAQKAECPIDRVMVVAAGQHPDMRRLDQAGRLHIPARVRQDGVAGLNRLRAQSRARVANRRIRVRYRAEATAVDAVGNRSKPARLRLTARAALRLHRPRR